MEETDSSKTQTKEMMIILGDEHKVVLNLLEKRIGRAILFEKFRNFKEQGCNWYFFKGKNELYWWLTNGNTSLNHQFMIFKNPIICIAVHYRMDRDVVDKLNSIYEICEKELLDQHPKMKLMVVGYHFNSNIPTHRRIKKEILAWCIEHRRATGEEDFCDYREDWIPS